MHASQASESHASTQALVTLEKVSFAYPANGAPERILRDVDFSVRGREIVQVRGRNGCGKTTLLKIVAGLLTPTSGTRTEAEGGVRTVYLDQNTAAFVGESLTVREQLAVGLSARIRPFQSSHSRAIEADLLRALNRYEVDLDKKLDRFTGELSGGQRQIVALLSVILGGFDVLVLDEFTASMDPTSAQLSAELAVKSTTEAGVGIVFVNHSTLGEISPDRTFDL